MCGICGIISLTNQPLSTDILQKVGRMNDALAHRGRDDAGVWHNDSVALAQRRLSIIDLSAAGHQPMVSPDNQTVITFNGEIYNYQDLKKQTPQYNYQGNSDTETLLAAYQKDGTAMLNKLNGMFAFAIWDALNKRLLIARDHLGIKPLYYYVNKDYLIFASEIRALLASDLMPKQLNKQALSAYLKYQTVYAPDTLVEGISMLMPGHFMDVKNGIIKIEPYWTLEKEFQISDSKFQIPNSKFQVSDSKDGIWNLKSEITKTVRQTLREAVDRQMMSDVPFGAFLSGGIDSSVVVGLMREVTSGDIDTFTISFAEKQFDEAPYARAISERFQTKHHEIRLSPDDFLDSLPDALNALDHPSGDAVNTYVVAKATKQQGVKMALSGLGGDELFGGYPIFKQSERLQKLSFLNHVPQGIRHSIGQILKKGDPSVQSRKIADVLSLESINPMSAYGIFREIFNTEQRQALLKNGYANPNIEISNSIKIPQYPNTPNLYSQVSIAEMNGYMQNVLLRDSDQMSMAHALELRVPLLDVELVKLVLSIPDAVKKGVGSKPLLVAAVSDLLPASLFDRPKMGFVLPFERWMRHELRDFCTLHLNHLADRPEFQSMAVKQLWQSFLAGEKGVSWSRLWTLVALAHWLKKNELT